MTAPALSVENIEVVYHHTVQRSAASPVGSVGQPIPCAEVRLADDGEPLVRGATALGGRLPVNLSGGLVSKGHPVGATGLSMIHEVALQLRGEAGARQARGAAIALVENGGGVMGFDEAACAVHILEKNK